MAGLTSWLFRCIIANQIKIKSQQIFPWIKGKKKEEEVMKKVLLLLVTLVAVAIFTSGCIIAHTGPYGYGHSEVNCDQKYAGNEKARTACQKGQAELQREIEKLEEKQAYNEGRGINTQSYGTYLYVDPVPYIVPFIIPPYYPVYPRHHYRYRR